MATMKFEADVGELVNATVEAALTEALGRNGTHLVKELVRLALESKKDRYSKNTLLHEALESGIRRVALERVKAWVDDNSNEIAHMVDERVRKELNASLVAETVIKSLKEMSIKCWPFSPAVEGEEDE